METIKSEEIYKYKDRIFNIKLLEKADGFHIIVEDEKTKKKIDHGKCSYESYFEIRKNGISKDPVEDVVAVMKNTINLWVDKGLI